MDVQIHKSGNHEPALSRIDGGTWRNADCPANRSDLSILDHKVADTVESARIKNMPPLNYDGHARSSSELIRH
jgi:hypothetical protein